MAVDSLWVPVWRLEDLADEELAVLARQGSATAAEYLMHRYRALVEGKARVFYFAGADRDDVIQEGMIGLVKAIRDFSADRCATFRSFAELCITRQIITALKSARRYKHSVLNNSVSIDMALHEDEEGGGLEEELVSAGAAPTPEGFAVVRGVLATVCDCVRADLSPLERAAFVGYASGLSYRHIAQQLGCRTKQVDNALQRAKKKIARRLAFVLKFVPVGACDRPT